MPAAIVNENGKVLEKDSVIPGSTQVRIIRTDNKSHVDLKGDDTIYRVTVEYNEEGGQYIDGTPIEELFDGLMFAG